MSEKMYRVQAGAVTREYPAGTPYGEIVREIPTENGLPVLLVMANGQLRELHKRLKEDCTLSPITAADRIGQDTYRRSLNLLFLKAVYDVTGKDIHRHAVLLFSNGNGYYYRLPGTDVTPELADAVQKRMRELADLKLPIRKETVSLSKARKFFRDSDMREKDRLFRYRRSSNVNMYRLEDYKNYFYGYMVWNTGYLKVFDVTTYENGLVLVLPEFSRPQTLRTFSPSPKLFQVQKQAEDWGRQMGIRGVADLNETICRGEMGHKMLVAEALQESSIARIAEQICARDKVKFVLIAGPSSSGKTTFSRRLSIQLTAHGKRPHPLSLDNFYRNRSECPRDEEGNYDFECLEALDLPLIRQTLERLTDGQEVLLPRFDFITGERKYPGDKLKLQDGDILVLEGIHGLNAKLSDFLPDESKFLIYISALTQLNVDEHNHISTTDGRLLRRIVRDYRTRGTSAQESIRMWPSVRRGENNYIFPHQENADAIFNSALIYEFSILKLYAEPLLFHIPENAPEYPEANRLLKFLDYFLGYPSGDVPENSILREFIGGSCFDV